MHAQIDGAVIDRPTTPTFQLRTIAGLRVHLIGIGGSGMSGAAALLSDFGAVVSGSDLSRFDGLAALVQRGVRVWIGHAEDQLGRDAELVVVSAAVPESNAELAAARQRGVPVMKYAQLLGFLTSVREGVAIAGTHGKSTTTGMCVHLFQRAGLSPSFIIGARSAQLGGSSGVGTGRHVIVESCEFDRSFLHLRPLLAAILNIESDHLDCYHDLDEIVEAFAEYAANVHPSGLLLCNADDERAVQAASAARCRVETFGLRETGDWRATNLRSDSGRFAFEIESRGARLLSAQLAIAGRHNVSNALAAVALAINAGAEPERVAEALATFRGVDRRLMWRGEWRGVTIVDDYAHHPTEIRVSIAAAKQRYAPRRTWVVFQPHQASRTQYFMEEFAASFGEADEVVMPDVYLARDKTERSSTPGSLELASRIGRVGGKARYVPELSQIAELLVNEVAEGDLVLTMGAGDVWKVADELVERLCGANRARSSPWAADVVPSGGARSVSVSAA